MAAPNSWDLALELELNVEETSRAVDECDFLRTPSTASKDDSSSTSRPDARKRPSTWWAALLNAAGEPLGFGECSSQTPSIHVVSACTGCAAEAWALKALGINFTMLAASDTNKNYRAFVLQNFGRKCQHMYDSMEMQMAAASDHDSSPCLKCRDMGVECIHEAASQVPVHLMVVGSPCDPFSVQRAKRFHEGQVKEHRDFYVTMKSLVSMFQVYQPQVAIVEQVKGFLLPLCVGSNETPFHRPAATSCISQFGFGRFGCAVCSVPVPVGVSLCECECFLVFFRKDKFSRDHVSGYKQTVQALLDWVAANHEELKSSQKGKKVQCVQELCQKAVLPRLCPGAFPQPAAGQGAFPPAAWNNWKKWQVQAYQLRREMKAGCCKPWTDIPGLKYAGIVRSERIDEVLNLAVLGFLGARRVLKLQQQGPAAVQEACYDLYTDVSQNPIRKSFTSPKTLASPCFTTSTALYSHARDRIILPIEAMLMQGHGLDMKIPDSMPRSALRDLAGEGICLPCIATLIHALQHTDSFAV
ncbi:unnamed protein product [Symbiodinium sp. CCMP2592]|nr:unnamed protein product [Symbiodinium sp. CCMP2592]